MNLTDYLQGIKDCPDEYVGDPELGDARLTREYGLYDNWAIFLGTDMDHFARLLRETGNFDVIDLSNDPYCTTGGYAISYVHGGNAAKHHLYAGTDGGYWGSRNDTPEGAKERERQAVEYKSTLLFHFLPNKEDFLSRLRTLANVVEEVCGVAMRENISLCIPLTYDTNQRFKLSLERKLDIVYFEPATQAQ